jgi:hypothetical protein
MLIQSIFEKSKKTKTSHKTRIQQKQKFSFLKTSSKRVHVHGRRKPVSSEKRGRNPIVLLEMLKAKPKYEVISGKQSVKSFV